MIKNLSINNLGPIETMEVSGLQNINLIIGPNQSGKTFLLFPMGLGLAGAALATAISPMLSIVICSRHFFQKDNTVQFVRQLPSAKLLGQSCQLGISGFVGEMSSGVTTTVFNFLLLGSLLS